MAELHLETYEDRTTFMPGESLHGLAGWELDRAPKQVLVRLSWYTDGKGDRDVEVVAEERFDNPPAVDAQTFSFDLPDRPYSFSGRLISLRWALELIVDGHHSKKLDLLIAPDGHEIDLSIYQPDEPTPDRRNPLTRLFEPR